MKLTASKITDIQNGSMENCADSNRSEMLYILGSAAFFLKVITCVCVCVFLVLWCILILIL